MHYLLYFIYIYIFLFFLFFLHIYIYIYIYTHTYIKRQDSTYHSLCYTTHGALAGTRNSSKGYTSENLLHPVSLTAISKTMVCAVLSGIGHVKDLMLTNGSKSWVSL